MARNFGHNIARLRYEILLAPEAIEDLNGLPAYRRSALRDVLESHLRREPERVSASRIKRLRGLVRPQYRLRVGDIRVFYDVREGRVEILAIVPKSEAAPWLERKGERS